MKLADDRGLIRDRGLVEASLASAYIYQAKLDLAFKTFQKALQDAIDSKNAVLEADILLALASEAQLKGNRARAIELVSRALSISEKNASLYEKARSLGEFGKLNLSQGKTDEGARSIDEALQIDKLNGYKFEALHLVYRGVSLGLVGKVDEALDSLVQARAKAVQFRDAYSFITAENTYALALVKKGRGEEAIAELGSSKSISLIGLSRTRRRKPALRPPLLSPFYTLLSLKGSQTLWKPQTNRIRNWRRGWRHIRTAVTMAFPQAKPKQPKKLAVSMSVSIERTMR